MLQRTAVLASCLAAFSLAACSSDPDSDSAPAAVTIRVLTANIGNPDDSEPNYPLRLSYQAYEDYVGARIRELGVDVAFLQEVLPPQTCEAFDETDPTRTCYQAASRPPAAKRILGDDYTVLCDARLHVECIGIRNAFGSVQGVDPGSFVVDGVDTPELPLKSCEYFAGNCDNDSCDGESDVGAITVQTASGPLRIVHVHPNAAGSNAAGMYDGEPCRYLQLQQVFEGDAALVGPSAPVLVAGDFNMDPESFASQREADLWNAQVGEGKRFSDIGPPRKEGGMYYPTRAIFALDHVIADGFSGHCKVHGGTRVSEEEPDVLPPLDDGFDFSTLPGGIQFAGRIDHASVSCDLSAP